MVCVVEHSLGRADGNVVSYSSAVCRGDFNSGVQQFPTFQLVASTEVRVKIHEGGEVGRWTGVFVVEGLLQEGAGENPEFVL
jgi:hypothetical protein